MEGVRQRPPDLREQLEFLKSRKEITEVPRLGAKAFEQAAGFLRIMNGKNPLDSSAVHPEAYPVVEKIAASVGATVSTVRAMTRSRSAGVSSAGSASVCPAAT